MPAMAPPEVMMDAAMIAQGEAELAAAAQAALPEDDDEEL